MTNPSQQPAQPQQPAVTNVTVTHPPANNLGLAGFITSILGLISCGVLSPIGLLLSLIGLTKRPRGFAIAGTVIGIIGTVFLALVGVGIVLGILGIGAGVKALKEYASTHEQAMKLYAEIEQRKAQGGAGTGAGTSAGAGNALDATTANALAAKYTDGWGTPLRADVAAGVITIISAGRDKSFDTQDDLRFNELDLKPATRPATTEPDGAGGAINVDE
jgi:hypothetical protein